MKQKFLANHNRKQIYKIKVEKISIIINADDLGYSTYVNSEIERYAKQHLISSVSVMANGPALNGAIKIVKKFPNLSVGAHLNVTEFQSLSAITNNNNLTFINKNGTFTGSIKYRKNIKPKFNKDTIQAIHYEWEMQIQKLLDLGIDISHIDSHNMVHYWNSLFPIIKQIQKKYNIKIIRMKDVKPLLFYGLFNKNLPKKTPPLRNETANYFWNVKLKYLHPRTNIVDHVFSYKSLCYYLSTGSKCPKRGTFEVVVHPGLDYMDYFQIENKLVEERYLESLLNNFKLINFNELS